MMLCKTPQRITMPDQNHPSLSDIPETPASWFGKARLWRWRGDHNHPSLADVVEILQITIEERELLKRRCLVAVRMLDEANERLDALQRKRRENRHGQKVKIEAKTKRA